MADIKDIVHTITKSEVEAMIAACDDNKQFGKRRRQACSYKSPCIIGAGLPKPVRKKLDRFGCRDTFRGERIGTTLLSDLIDNGVVAVEEGVKARELVKAQNLFDNTFNEDNATPRRIKNALKRAIARPKESVTNASTD